MKQTSTAYRGYLIRSSHLHARYWIERENHFIGWATDLDDAKRIIDTLTAR